MNFDDPLYETLTKNSHNRAETKRSIITIYSEPVA